MSLIHDKAKLLILLKHDDANLRHVYRDYVNTDTTFENFPTFANTGKCCLLVTDEHSQIHLDRYRRRFNELIRNVRIHLNYSLKKTSP